MEPKFELGQKVVITGSSKKGVVIGRWEEWGGGIQYQVRYFDNDDCAHATWFFTRELEEVAAG